MLVTHEPWLVALSLVVAIQGAYVGLTLAVQVAEAQGLRRRLLLAGAAFSLAVAIWAMHFVGMLAVRVAFVVDFLAFPTLMSFLVCVIVVGAAVFAASAVPLSRMRLATSAVAMGCGIVTMHYIGMMAWQACTQMIYAPGYVAASVVIAIAASGLALSLASGRGGRVPLLLSASVLGMAISGMHYTAMAGTTLFPLAGTSPGAPALSSDLLAIVVAVVAFLVSAIFLLLLVPDRPAAKIASPSFGLPDQRNEFAGLAIAGVTGAEPYAHNGALDAAYARRDGDPHRTLARHLPVQRDGTTHLMAVDDIVAVHANAHYTYIFDGTTKLFCPLAISDVEGRLDDRQFMRVHRSHIVNIERIAGLKRAGDNGVIELAASERYTIPVSRSRFGSLKSRLGARPSEVHA